MMPQYPGFGQLNQPYSHAKQWSDKEMKALRRMIVADFVASLLNLSATQNMPFNEALLYIKNSVYFHHMAQNQYHTETTIE